MPMMVYSILGIMSLGGIGDLFHFLQSRQIENAGGTMLLGGVCTAVAGGGLVWLTRTGLRKRDAKHLPPVPEGEQEAVFQESGWSVAASVSGVPTPMQPWTELHSSRSGPHTMVAVGASNTFAAVPLRALSPGEAGHLQRMLARKLRPSLQDDLKVATA